VTAANINLAEFIIGLDFSMLHPSFFIPPLRRGPGWVSVEVRVQEMVRSEDNPRPGPDGRPPPPQNWKPVCIVRRGLFPRALDQPAPTMSIMKMEA
jgi:hypothetical protein